MLLFIYWVYFIIFSSQFFSSLRLAHYLLFSWFMLGVTLIYNEKIKVVMGVKNFILLLMIPYSIYWYMAITYNNFLVIHPFSYDFIINILFLLTYLILYLFWELKL